jgi:parvulin-like peptidyl-prolyl isomerase
MKIRYFAPILLLLLAYQTMLGQGSVSNFYVKVPEENLRSAPNGKKIGALLEGAATTILVEKDSWVKVQVTGWIWKPSLTTTRPSNIAGQLRALHILVKTRAEAEEILQSINSGKDFKEVARAKSIAPSASNGGDLGYFSKGDFNVTIESAIEGLAADQVSGVVESSFGFNLFKRIK